MASCNGAHPSNSSINNSTFNLGISAEQDGRFHLSPIGSVPSRQDRAGRSGLDSINDLLHAMNQGTEDAACGPITPIPVCDKCAGVAIWHCWQCKLILCEECAADHVMRYLTRSHSVKRLDDPTVHRLQPYVTPDLSLGNVSNGHIPRSLSTNCEKHRRQTTLYQCNSCEVTMCRECSMLEHAGHVVVLTSEFARKKKRALLENVSVRLEAVQRSMDTFDIVQRFLMMKKRDAVNAAECDFQKFMKILCNRKDEILAQINNIYTLKISSLGEQKERVLSIQQSLVRMQEYLLQFSLSDQAFEVGAMYKLYDQLAHIKNFPLTPCEDDVLKFLPPDPLLYHVIPQMGCVRSSVDLKRVVARGRCKARARYSLLNEVYVDLYDHLGNPCQIAPERDSLSVLLLHADETRAGPVNVQWSPGQYKVSYKPLSKSTLYLHIKIRGQHIKESPFVITVTIPREYRNIREPCKVFASEGGGDGQLCRPWGVCCDLDKNIIVADRSNNRIQIFGSNGMFYHQFGKHGTEPGQFDRPAGIASDLKRRIVVADKDNHRIQVFRSDGEFLFTFGERGSNNGQFHYPWDVDVNTEGRIIVSDTRNHRVQLFSPNGHFLLKFGYENGPGSLRHFDSPRGVCFDNDGKVIVTDFNNHCLVILTAQLTDAQYLGKEGIGAGEFSRPQGVCVDDDGRIIVVDSRNDRIQILEHNGTFIHQFGSTGTAPGQFDRPCGICLDPEGRIVVVDFTNNRIQVF